MKGFSCGAVSARGEAPAQLRHRAANFTEPRGGDLGVLLRSDHLAKRLRCLFSRSTDRVAVPGGATLIFHPALALGSWRHAPLLEPLDVPETGRRRFCSPDHWPVAAWSGIPPGCCRFNWLWVRLVVGAEGAVSLGSPCSPWGRSFGCSPMEPSAERRPPFAPTPPLTPPRPASPDQPGFPAVWAQSSRAPGSSSSGRIGWK